MNWVHESDCIVLNASNTQNNNHQTDCKFISIVQLFPNFIPAAQRERQRKKETGEQKSLLILFTQVSIFKARDSALFIFDAYFLFGLLSVVLF